MILAPEDKLSLLLFVDNRLPVAIFDALMRLECDLNPGDSITINYEIRSEEWFAAVNMPEQIKGQAKAEEFREKLHELKEIYDEFQVARV